MLKSDRSCTTHNATCFKMCFSKTWDQLLFNSHWLRSKFKCFLFIGPSFLKDESVQASSMSSGGTLSPGQQEGSYFEPWALCHSSRSHSLTVALRMAVAIEVGKLACSFKDVYPAAASMFFSRFVVLNWFSIHKHAGSKHRQSVTLMWINVENAKVCSSVVK